MITCCFNHAMEEYNRMVDKEDFNTKLSYLSRMFLCTNCGNKRCPKATDCSFECTKNNEPNQEGSRY